MAKKITTVEEGKRAPVQHGGQTISAVVEKLKAIDEEANAKKLALADEMKADWEAKGAEVRKLQDEMRFLQVQYHLALGKPVPPTVKAGSKPAAGKRTRLSQVEIDEKARQLPAFLKDSEKSRKEIADHLGVKPSQVTTIVARADALKLGITTNGKEKSLARYLLKK